MMNLVKLLVLILLILASHVAYSQTYAVEEQQIAKELEILRNFEKDYKSRTQNWARLFSKRMQEHLNEQKASMDKSDKIIKKSFVDVPKLAEKIRELIQSKKSFKEIREHIKVMHDKILISSQLWSRYQIDFLRSANEAVCFNEDKFSLYFLRQGIDPTIDYNEACKHFHKESKDLGNMCSSYGDYTIGLLTAEVTPEIYSEIPLEEDILAKGPTKKEVEDAATDIIVNSIAMQSKSPLYSQKEKEQVQSLLGNKPYMERTKNYFAKIIEAAVKAKVEVEVIKDKVQKEFQSALQKDFAKEGAADLPDRKKIHQEMLETFRGKGKREFGELMLDHELIKMTRNGEKITQVQYEGLKEKLSELKERVKKVRNNRSLTEDVIQEIVNEVHLDYFKIYRKGFPGIAGMLDGKGGNCVAQTVLYHTILGEDTNIGVQVFNDHLQLVKYDKEKNTVLSFVSGEKVEGVQSPIVKAQEYLLGSAINNINSSSLKDADVTIVIAETNLIAKPKEQPETPHIEGVKGNKDRLDFLNSSSSLLNKVTTFSSEEVPDRAELSSIPIMETTVSSDKGDGPIPLVVDPEEFLKFESVIADNIIYSNIGRPNETIYFSDEEVKQKFLEANKDGTDKEFQKYLYKRRLDIYNETKVLTGHLELLDQIKNNPEKLMTNPNANLYLAQLEGIFPLWQDNDRDILFELEQENPKLKQVTDKLRDVYSTLSSDKDKYLKFIQNSIIPESQIQVGKSIQVVQKNPSSILLNTKIQILKMDKYQAASDEALALSRLPIFGAPDSAVPESYMSYDSEIKDKKKVKGDKNGIPLDVLTDFVWENTYFLSDTVKGSFQRKFTNEETERSVLSKFTPQAIELSNVTDDLKKLISVYYVRISELSKGDHSAWPLHPAFKKPIRPDLVAQLKGEAVDRINFLKDLLLVKSVKEVVATHNSVVLKYDAPGTDRYVSLAEFTDLGITQKMLTDIKSVGGRKLIEEALQKMAGFYNSVP